MPTQADAHTHHSSELAFTPRQAKPNACLGCKAAKPKQDRQGHTRADIKWRARGMSFTLCRTISAAPNRAGLSARNPQANRVYGLDQASWPAKSRDRNGQRQS